MESNKLYFKWNCRIIIITVIALMLIIGLYAHTILQLFFGKLDLSLKILQIIVFIVLLACSIWFATNTPIYTQYNKNEIKIKTIIGYKKIESSEIKSVRQISANEISKSSKKIGSSGVGGYTGLFYNSTLGNYYQYVTEYKNLILIETIDKKYVFNCKDAKKLADFAKIHWTTE